MIALFYNGLTVSGWRRATPGMKLMDLEVSLNDGRPVPFINAAAHAVLFYLSWTILTPLSLLVCFFTQNKRCLHDMLADVVVHSPSALKWRTPGVRIGSGQNAIFLRKPLPFRTDLW